MTKKNARKTAARDRLREAPLLDVHDPAKLMAFWKDRPEAKKCVGAKRLRMGVTDDHPENPRILWTSLARTKDCPGFTEWWNALPEAKPYHR